jgi:hypothetical protein
MRPSARIINVLVSYSASYLGLQILVNGEEHPLGPARGIGILSGFDEHKIALEQLDKLLARRRQTIAFFIAINVGIVTAIIGLFWGRQVSYLELGALSLLLGMGISFCSIWRSLLGQYQLLIEWWDHYLRDLAMKCLLSPDPATGNPPN